MTELCCVRRVSQIHRGQFGETRSISIFVKKKILVTEMYIIVNDVCEHDLTNRPDSPTTFPGTCKGNFLCLQMISFEFLRVDPIG